jgi:hypothetical protein
VIAGFLLDGAIGAATVFALYALPLVVVMLAQILLVSSGSGGDAP